MAGLGSLSCGAWIGNVGLMTSAELLADGFGRIQQLVDHVLDGLGPQELQGRLDPSANTIGWLIWHLTRVQDDHLAEVGGAEQVWTAQAWHERFGLPFEADATGYGFSATQVAQVQVSGELLRQYHEAVYRRSVDYIATLTDKDLGRVVDTSWDPPVTLGARLVSVLSDDLQHAGQAAFIRGVIERAG